MKKSTHASGKRKRSIAKATLTEGKGIIRINSILLDNYKPEISKLKIMEPLEIAGNVSKKINIIAKVNGGGYSSQADAVRLAIARALVAYTKDNSLKKAFLEYDRHLLVGDVRFKETCKPNDSKARAKRQKSYR